jgi:signal transduction histidine kinase
LKFARSLSKILDLNLNLMCESYMHASMQNLHALNEQLERANRELAEASRAKDEFLAQTSHELRTPLNSILGFTKLILDGLAKNPEEERQLLRDVFQSAQHLLGLVNDILDIGRIEAGRISLHIEDVNPRHILDSTLPLVAVSAAEKSLTVRDETRDEPLPTVRADEVRFRQVLLNLLSNAVKFTEEGGVALRAKVERDGGGAAVAVRFEVSDTGIGIPEDKREAVFEKFIQVNPALSRRHGGTGLGLAISRRLVEFMGGTIGLETNPEGRGTLAWFTLPVSRAGEEQRSASAQGRARQEAKRP